MIYGSPAPPDPVDQGDLIEGCPALHVREFRFGQAETFEIDWESRRVIILTQTCDLVQEKITSANVAEVFDARQLVDNNILKPADVKGPLRSGRIWGLYFLPADASLGLNEMIVDLRRLHTVRLDLPRELCRAGKRRARLHTPYREHFAKHFADTFSRIGLPRPYETL